MPARKFSILGQTFQLMTRLRQIICCDRRKLCHDTTFRSALKGKKTLSVKRILKSRQTQHEVEVNSVATKTATVATEVEKKDT